MTLYLGLLSGVSAILYKNENDLPNIRAKVKLDYPTKALLSLSVCETQLYLVVYCAIQDTCNTLISKFYFMIHY